MSRTAPSVFSADFLVSLRDCGDAAGDVGKNSDELTRKKHGENFQAMKFGAERGSREKLSIALSPHFVRASHCLHYA